MFVARNEETRMTGMTANQHALAIETGAGLYDLHCASCHGSRGEGIEKMGPALNEEHFFTARLAEIGWPGTLEEYINVSITGGRLVSTRPEYKHAGGKDKPVMNAWALENGGSLRPDQIRDLTTFVLNWQATALNEVELESLPPLEEDEIEMDSVE
jgi:mono/diheme cytochrome c family protein